MLEYVIKARDLINYNFFTYIHDVETNKESVFVGGGVKNQTISESFRFAPSLNFSDLRKDGAKKYAYRDMSL